MIILVIILTIIATAYCVIYVAILVCRFLLTKEREVFAAKEDALAAKTEAEVNKALAAVHKEYSGSFAAQNERLLLSVIRYALPKMNTSLSSPTQLNVGESNPRSNGATHQRSNAALSEGEKEEIGENKPFEWKVPKDLQEKGTLRSGANYVKLENENGEVIQVPIPSKGEGLVKFAHGYYLGCCENKGCYNRFFTIKKDGRFCGDACRNENHRFKLK